MHAVKLTKHKVNSSVNHHKLSTPTPRSGNSRTLQSSQPKCSSKLLPLSKVNDILAFNAIDRFVLLLNFV